MKKIINTGIVKNKYTFEYWYVYRGLNEEHLKIGIDEVLRKVKNQINLTDKDLVVVNQIALVVERQNQYNLYYKKYIDFQYTRWFFYLVLPIKKGIIYILENVYVNVLGLFIIGCYVVLPILKLIKKCLIFFLVIMKSKKKSLLLRIIEKTFMCIYKSISFLIKVSYNCSCIFFNIYLYILLMLCWVILLQRALYLDSILMKSRGIYINFLTFLVLESNVKKDDYKENNEHKDLNIDKKDFIQYYIATVYYSIKLMVYRIYAMLKNPFTYLGIIVYIFYLKNTFFNFLLENKKYPLLKDFVYICKYLYITILYIYNYLIEQNKFWLLNHLNHSRNGMYTFMRPLMIKYLLYLEIEKPASFYSTLGYTGEFYEHWETLVQHLYANYAYYIEFLFEAREGATVLEEKIHRIMEDTEDFDIDFYQKGKKDDLFEEFTTYKEYYKKIALYCFIWYIIVYGFLKYNVIGYYMFPKIFFITYAIIIGILAIAIFSIRNDIARAKIGRYNEKEGLSNLKNFLTKSVMVKLYANYVYFRHGDSILTTKILFGIWYLNYNGFCHMIKNNGWLKSINIIYFFYNQGQESINGLLKIINFYQCQIEHKNVIGPIYSWLEDVYDNELDKVDIEEIYLYEEDNYEGINASIEDFYWEQLDIYCDILEFFEEFASLEPEDFENGFSGGVFSPFYLEKTKLTYKYIQKLNVAYDEIVFKQNFLIHYKDTGLERDKHLVWEEEYFPLVNAYKEKKSKLQNKLQKRLESDPIRKYRKFNVLLMSVILLILVGLPNYNYLRFRKYSLDEYCLYQLHNLYQLFIVYIEDRVPSGNGSKQLRLKLPIRLNFEFYRMPYFDMGFRRYINKRLITTKHSYENFIDTTVHKVVRRMYRRGRRKYLFKKYYNQHYFHKQKVRYIDFGYHDYHGDTFDTMPYFFRNKKLNGCVRSVLDVDVEDATYTGYDRNDFALPKFDNEVSVRELPSNESPYGYSNVETLVDELEEAPFLFEYIGHEVYGYNMYHAYSKNPPEVAKNFSEKHNPVMAQLEDHVYHMIDSTIKMPPAIPVPSNDAEQSDNLLGALMFFFCNIFVLLCVYGTSLRVQIQGLRSKKFVFCLLYTLLYYYIDLHKLGEQLREFIYWSYETFVLNNGPDIMLELYENPELLEEYEGRVREQFLYIVSLLKPFFDIISDICYNIYVFMWMNLDQIFLKILNLPYAYLELSYISMIIVYIIYFRLEFKHRRVENMNYLRKVIRNYIKGPDITTEHGRLRVQEKAAFQKFKTSMLEILVYPVKKFINKKFFKGKLEEKETIKDIDKTEVTKEKKDIK